MSIRVFINSSGIDVPAGSSALEAVRAFDPTAADEISTGQRQITDSRGLPLDPAAPMSAGSILRLVARRDKVAE